MSGNYLWWQLSWYRYVLKLGVDNHIIEIREEKAVFLSENVYDEIFDRYGLFLTRIK